MFFRWSLPAAAWTGLLATIFAIVNRKLFDYDLWWHLACGRVMVEGRVFPKQEIFSHTLAGTPWVNFEWLGQILLYLVVKTLGLNALLAGKVTLIFVVVGLLVFITRRHGARGPLLLLLTIAGFLALRPRLYERIELATFVLFPIYVGALSSLRHWPVETARKVPWVLFGLMVLWSNVHGGFVYGIGAAALMAVGARWSGEPLEIIGRYDRTVTLLLIAMFFTPFGLRLPEIFIEHAIQFSGGPQLIEEWAPTSLHSNISFWVLFALTGTAVITGLHRKNATAKFWGPVVLVFALWGTRHQRNAATLVFFALPFLAEYAAGLSGAQQWMRRPATRWGGWAAGLGLLLLMRPLMEKPGSASAIVENRFPVGACDFIKKNNVQGTLYNTYHLGGYIEWTLGPSHPVFMDGRYLFQPLLVQHERLDKGLAHNPDGAAWSAYLNSLGVDLAIVDYTPRLFSSQGRTPFPLAWQNLVFPRTGWALVYWDDAAMFFVKRTPAFAPLIKRFEYKTLWPYNLDQMQILLTAKMIPRDQLEHELQRHAEEVGGSAIRQHMYNRFKK